MAENEINSEQRKTIVKILAFHALEKAVIKHYNFKRLSRIHRTIQKKWRKVLPEITPENLVLQVGGENGEVKSALDTLILYSRLYVDLIDPRALNSCTECIEKLKTKGIGPRLTEDFESRINSIIAPKVRKKKPSLTQVIRTVSKDYPHLDPEVRRRLTKHFKHRLKEREPLIMLDHSLQLRIEGFIRGHVDRAIDLFLEHAYKAIQYGFIPRSSTRLSTYVEQKAMESIDWTVDNDVIVDELVKSIS
ncbi:hypothetical protein BMS3Bbin16_00997 [archaeon BMS3Bbin16]|nr:hypothetical protein BMS3Bbin16_00997 [archaeon BMS3Bbin16]